MSNPKEKEKVKSPFYIVTAPMETLLDDGLQFEGDTDKDRMINMTDFIRVRDMFQRFDQNLTIDHRETLLRVLNSCIKSPDAS